MAGLLVAGVVHEASAQTQALVTIDRGAGFARAAAELGYGVELDALEAGLGREIRAVFGAANVPEFLRLSANAQSLANRGLGADYASNPDGAFFGFAVGAAIEAENANVRDVEVPVSAGVQLALMGGYNFSAVGAPGLTVSLKGIFLPLSVEQLDGAFATMGAQIQYKLFGPVGGPFLEWGGVDLTAGFEWSRARLELAESNFDTILVLERGVTVNGAWAGRLELTQTARSIPLEITSNLTVLSFLTAYAGVGMTFQVGDASANIELEARSLNLALEGQALDLGAARIRVADAGGSDPIALHVLTGLQLNVWKFHVFGQVTVPTRDQALGVATGLRFTI